MLRLSYRFLKIYIKNKDLEKQIEEAAYNNTESLMFSHNSLETKSMARRLDNSFITGAKSETSKQYWQQGMYSEEDMLNFSFWLLNNIGETSNDRVAHFDNRHYLNKWLEQNKKK